MTRASLPGEPEMPAREVVVVQSDRYEAPMPLQSAFRRDRLVTLLDLAVHQRLTVLVAPAGYGKTVLLRQWATAHRDHQVRWITLREGDDGAELVQDLSDALLPPADPSEGPSESARDLGATWFLQGAGAITAVFEERADYPPTVLVLDDFQRLSSSAVVDALAALIEHAPRALRIAVASRVHPPIRFSRLRLSDALVEFRQQDLAFTEQEACAFLQRELGDRASPRQIESLAAQTEGWAAGLAMVVRRVRDSEDADDAVGSLAHDPHFATFFRTQVLDGHDAKVVDFLVSTAVLTEMSGPICDFLLEEEGAQAKLEELERTSTFLTRVDLSPSRYRSHPLFRTFLRDRLHAEDPRRERRLLERAAAWHLEHEELEPALRYLAEAASWDRFVQAALEQGEHALRLGQAEMLVRCIRELPAEIRRERPDVALVESAALLATGDVEALDETLETVERRHDVLSRPKSTDLLAAALLRAYGAVARGAVRDVIASANRTLDIAAGLDDLETVSVLGLAASRTDAVAAARHARGVALLQVGQVSDAAEDLSAALVGAHPIVRVSALSALARVESWCRRLTAAQHYGTQALALAEQLELVGQPAVVGAHVALAQVARARGQLEEASAVVQRAGAVVDLSRRPIATALVATERALIALAEGRPEAGLAILADRQHRDRVALPPAVRALRQAAVAELLITTGDLDGAARVLYRMKHLDTTEIMSARVRLAVEREDLVQAREVVCTWSALPVRGSPLPRELWLAVLDRLDGDEDGARARVAEVAAVAEDEGDFGLFLAAGQDVLGPVRALYRAAPSAFLREIVESDARARVRPAKQLVEQLTGREYTVLTMLPNRLSNLEIADRLGMSLNTLKTHLKHIYRKLGVEGRNEAVSTAERIHLI